MGILPAPDLISDERRVTTVGILLDDQEATIDIIDFPPDQDYHVVADVDAYVLVYNTTDRVSFQHVIETLYAMTSEERDDKAVILVGNKIDLVRTRQVSAKEGRMAAEAHKCKYIEVSGLMNLQVDDLLVGIVKQIRLHIVEQMRAQAACDGRRSPIAFIGRFLKKQGVISKSCDNLLVL